MEVAVQEARWQTQWRQLAVRASIDSALRARLRTEPECVLREQGIEFPEFVELRIVDDTLVPHMIIPAISSGESVAFNLNRGRTPRVPRRNIKEWRSIRAKSCPGKN